MTKNNAEHFMEMLRTNEAARRALGRLAEGFAGDKADDRAVYEQILSPVAKQYGVDLSYEEAQNLEAGAHQLSDEELDAVAGGTGMTMYQHLIAGVLTGVMVVGAVPAAALAEEAQGGADAGGEAVVQVDDSSAEEGQADENTDADGEDLLADGGFQLVSFAETSSSSNGWASSDAKEVAKDVTTATKTMSDVGKLFVGLGSATTNPNLVFNGADGLMGDFLNIMGLGSTAPGPTIADVMKELKDIEGKLDRMDQKLNNIENGVDIANARTLISSTNDLSTYCDTVENMFSDQSLAKLGVGPCPEGADEKARAAWLDEAVAAVKKADASDTAGFVGYRSDMNEIRSLFTDVANAAKEDMATNPIGSWDEYWENYYNWETEAYVPKQALRTQTATQISRAYALLAAYYHIYDDVDHNEPSVTQLAQDALNNINSLDPGVSPADLTLNDQAGNPISDWRNWGTLTYSHHVYSYTLQRYATRFQQWAYRCNYNATGAAVQDSAINEYKSRLHGMSIMDDLKFAGLLPEDYTPQSKELGIAYQGELSGGHWWARVLYWNGECHSLKTSGNDSDGRGGGIYGSEFVDLGLGLS
ncbi:MAG: hypothetical protein Q4B54_06750 [Coriobacteriales bacterium]|nr:hypothetical protein [Coriobacteriales bacterium]